MTRTRTTTTTLRWEPPVELEVETRVHRVGGNLVWDEWSWTPDNLVTWFEMNLIPLLTVATGLVLAYVVWRMLRGNRTVR